MLNRTLRALNRLVVRRNADAGLDVRAPDRAAPSVTLRGQGTSRRVRLLGALSLAALLLATFAALPALPLRAQSVVEVNLVSNLDTSTSNTSVTQLAQRFTSGPGSSNHAISAVDLAIGTTGSSNNGIRLELRENNASNRPGTLVATLQNPPTFTPNSINRFTAPVGTSLTPDTVYWLEVTG